MRWSRVFCRAMKIVRRYAASFPRATLYRGACIDCNHGIGKTGSVDLSGRWQGSFELLVVAKPEKWGELEAMPKVSSLHRPVVDSLNREAIKCRHERAMPRTFASRYPTGVGGVAFTRSRYDGTCGELRHSFDKEM